MKRRAFIVGSSALTLSQLASGCNSWQQPSLKVRLLQDSIPAQLVGEFRKALKLSAPLKFDPEEQLQILFTRLQTWKRQVNKENSQQQWRIPFIGRNTPAISADLVTLGDYWLESAIQQELIQPLNVEKLKGWQQLPPRWQEIVRRDRKGQLSNSGQVWGAPYRWGTTVIAYRRDKFKALGWTPTDWSDLWRPELRSRISLLDQPREVIGLTLKKLGFSYNTTNLSQVPNLKEELQALHQQVKFYSSDHYLQPLILEDTWLAVGWSTDVFSVRTSRPIEVVVPQSGTALWADMWVQPASPSMQSNATETDTHQSLAKQWIEFCWQPKQAIELSVLSNAASPIIASLDPAKLPKAISANHVLLPQPSVLDKSEFLKPLPESAVEQYQALWQEIRTANL
ncbi:MAG: extracellular solute-binding protein [Coleofasciculus sp. S288]|nr:extracellular solute-binding protein [Coleofasciculus sp. S288]